MSAKITPLVSDYIHEYIAEWKIENSVASKELGKTPVFSPTPYTDSRFHLEMHRKSNGIDFTLVKTPGTTNKSLKMKMELRVIDMRGNCFKHYRPSTIVSVSTFTNFTFSEEITSDLEDYAFNSQYGAYHPNYLVGHYSFLISCRLVFFEFSLTRPIACRKEKWHYDDSAIGKPSVLGDIELQINNQSFAVHRALLQERAPIFLKKLCERNPYQSDELKLKDNSFLDVNFECFLNYLYSGEIKDKFWPTVKTLYTFAHKYDMQDLKRDCSSIVASSMNVASVCGALKIAYDCDDDDLKQKANAFAAAHVSQLMKTSEWKELVLKYPLIGYNVMAISFSEK